jgi:hypothetical protein
MAWGHMCLGTVQTKSANHQKYMLWETFRSFTQHIIYRHIQTPCYQHSIPSSNIPLNFEVKNRRLCNVHTIGCCSVWIRWTKENHLQVYIQIDIDIKPNFFSELFLAFCLIQSSITPTNK